jgi:hypothetical protein
MVCTEYPNPFLDKSLSRAAIDTKIFQNGDTVLIFSSETLSVVTYLREHIKEVTVHIDNNRFWKSDTVFHEEEFSADPINIPISFYRTGWNKIVITTVYKNDETKIEVDSLYARSPLEQLPITALVGDSIHLKTLPVKDADVNYVWDFHDSLTKVKEFTPQFDFVLKYPISSLIGELYVIDRNNNRSPSVYFATTAGSGSKLNISAVSGLIKGDTIITGESHFMFKVYINGSISKAVVNGLSFDSSEVSSNGVNVSKMFNNLDTLKDPMKVTVTVTDKNSQLTEKIFFIKYDANQTSLLKISVTSPNVIRDTSFVLKSTFTIYGNVTNHAQYEKLYLNFSLNGFTKGYCKLLAANDEWEYKITFAYGWNKLRLELSKDSTGTGTAIVSKEIQVKYDSTMNDFQPPKIKNIKIDGIAIAGDNSFTTSGSVAVLTMDVSDNKGIKSVLVNNDSARVQQNDLTYSVSITPGHTIGGTQYIIKATDLSDIVITDTITGLFNHTPQIESVSFPSSMRTDSVYHLIVRASDGDAGDKLTKTIIFQRPSGDSTITLVNDTVLWKPVIADTGENTIFINVTDEFSASHDTMMAFTVYQKTDKPLKVSWLTTSDDFPKSIIVGQEKLTAQLKITPNTGIPPFTFTASMDNPYIVIYKGSDSQFTWSPNRSDAGVRTLSLTVTDMNGDSDVVDILLNIIAHPAAIVSFNDQTMTLNENSTGDATIVRLSTPLPDSVKIPYSIKLIDALSSDIDMPQSGVILFNPGDTIAKLPIKLVNDFIPESDKKFSIILSDLPPLSNKDTIALNKNNSAVEITIRDDDKRTVKYSFIGSASSGSEKVTEVTIKVTLDTTLDRDLELSYYLDKLNSTADSSDFSFASTNQTLTFKAGVKDADFKILIVNDTKPEPDRALVFKLQTNDPAAIPGANTSFQYTIIDDDIAAKVGVMLKPDQISLPEGATPNIGVVLTAALKSDITVTIRAKESSTARANFDYTISSNKIVVKAGTTSQSMGLTVIKDNFPEPPRTVEFEIIAISDMVNAEIINSAKTMKVTITDN